MVGATTPDHEGRRPPPAPRRERTRRTGRRRARRPSRRAFRLVSLVAALGLVGTLVFGVLYATKSAAGRSQDPAVVSASRAFLTDFFNFNAKTVDSDFNAVTGMATGAFSTQAQQFFNTSIRKALEQALAESRGQIRYLAVQSENQGAGTASVYAVVDQTYVNNKITSPQADVVRLDRRPPAGRRRVEDLQRDGAGGCHPRQRRQRLGLAPGSNVPGQ